MTAQWTPLPATLEPDNPLWQFALAAWTIPAVEQHCLALQARGWSVTRLLTAAWQASLGQTFIDESAVVLQWRTEVTAPLRQLRKQLPREHSTIASLRSKVASAELEAERMELALVFHHTHTTTASAAPTEQLIRDNLRKAAPPETQDTETERRLAELSRHFSRLSPNGASRP
ncbi:TIGR02444 family protein [Marinobacter xestospongiae]|uniref:TIGR02444 family protein n=1 Tax=Marinobacter xestospongiae TaxID=994319 RepID=A0ABU3VVT7_9GAMM|nr:TIGR02444 family protein [Marinobacter xestospongiae]MDV2078379.1 TIGR02444 family protein [Marinobacter xestospongiae]